MKKRDLKKLALLGLTGGIMLGSQSVIANEAETSGTLLAHNGCGANSCNNQPNGPSRTGRTNARTSNSCGAPSSPNGTQEASNSCNAQSGTRNGCNSYFRNARNSTQPNEIAEADEQVT